MARRVHQKTWAEVGFRNAGMRQTTRALKFALGWGLATATLGREPKSVEEYFEVMDESRATAYRDRQAFLEAFPTESTPYRMNDVSGAQARYNEVWKRLKDLKQVAREIQPLVFVLGAQVADV